MTRDIEEFDAMNSTPHYQQLAHMPFMNSSVAENETTEAATSAAADSSLASYARSERSWRYQEAAIFSVMLIVVVLICATQWTSS
jgi:hypothetical protein